MIYGVRHFTDWKTYRTPRENVKLLEAFEMDTEIEDISWRDKMRNEV